LHGPLALGFLFFHFGGREVAILGEVVGGLVLVKFGTIALGVDAD